jgi:hypothetical protein
LIRPSLIDTKYYVFNNRFENVIMLFFKGIFIWKYIKLIFFLIFNFFFNISI